MSDEIDEVKQSVLQVERYKAELATVLMHRTENFRAVIQLGQNALTSAMFVNCVAVAVVLVTKASPVSLFLFLSGAGLAALASGGTYMTQFCYAADDAKRGGLFKIGTIFNVVVISLVATSYAVFAVGLAKLGS